ncbi:Aste57867_3737 [Aphanomyces stellatus]|uniref:Aste57867_3737 protein n=1 Tax=Aphanomyces stellatus TaxID=120398 RepID=A0A485KCP3_9STRA|nr:hypothetical protein As57867_003726 [Aphanomyces stellatus]VFT80890.1 Aste57867_3737 [Aphanomyces stellatus]
MHVGTTYVRISHYNAESKHVAISTQRLPTPSVDLPSRTTLAECNAWSRLLGSNDDKKLADIAVNGLQHRPFQFVGSDNHGCPLVHAVTSSAGTKPFTIDEVSTMLLIKTIEVACASLGIHVATEAVLAVPPSVDDDQVQRIQDAAALAGLTIRRVVHKCVAAIQAHGLDLRARGEPNLERHFLIVDVARMRLEASIVTVDGGTMELLSTSGDDELGGEVFTRRVLDFLVDKWQRQTKIEMDNRAWVSLRQQVERAKRLLSTHGQVRLEMESIGSNNAVDFDETLTRRHFEHLTRDLFQRIMRHVNAVMHDSGLRTRDVEHIVLLGGDSRMPKLHQLIEDYFNGSVPRFVGIPPDDVAVYGAAILGGRLAGAIKPHDILMQPVIRASMGVDADGVMAQFLRRGTHAPTQIVRMLSTDQDDQPVVSLRIFEGERTRTKDNRVLGHFEVLGLTPTPHGVSQVQLTLDVDEENQAHVSVVRKGSNDKNDEHEVTVTVDADEGRLTVDDIDHMVDLEYNHAGQEAM